MIRPDPSGHNGRMPKGSRFVKRGCAVEHDRRGGPPPVRSSSGEDGGLGFVTPNTQCLIALTRRSVARCRERSCRLDGMVPKCEPHRQPGISAMNDRFACVCDSSVLLSNFFTGYRDTKSLRFNRPAVIKHTPQCRGRPTRDPRGE